MARQARQEKRGRPRRTLAIVMTVIIVLLGGYGVADAVDLVPGILTLEPEVEPIKYPTAPGATVPGAATPLASAPDIQAPKPQPEALAALLDPMLASPLLGPETALLVVDQLTGETLFDQVGDSLRTPASTLKILTAVAVLHELGAAHTLTTQVVAGDTESSIVLVGGGDMMLAAGPGSPEKINGRAGMADLAGATAEKLRATGTAAVSLEVDDSMFSGPTTAATMGADDLAIGYIAPVTSLAVDIARLDPTKEYSKRHADPTIAAADVFAKQLAENGIAVSHVSRKAKGPGSDAAAKTTPSDETESGNVLASVESAPLGEIVAYFLQHSDNTITEVGGRLTAAARELPASFDGATEAVEAAMNDLGVDTTGLHMADCSGLAEGSQLMAKTLTDAVRVAGSGDHLTLRQAVTGLPISGLNGTLSDRLTAPTVAGEVRAKTGSLKGVSSLAGVITDVDQRVLVFAIISNGGPDYSQTSHPAIDAIVKALQGCGCSG